MNLLNINKLTTSAHNTTIMTTTKITIVSTNKSSYDGKNNNRSYYSRERIISNLLSFSKYLFLVHLAMALFSFRIMRERSLLVSIVSMSLHLLSKKDVAKQKVFFQLCIFSSYSQLQLPTWQHSHLLLSFKFQFTLIAHSQTWAIHIGWVGIGLTNDTIRYRHNTGPTFNETIVSFDFERPSNII